MAGVKQKGAGMKFRYDRLERLARAAGFHSDAELAHAAGVDKATLSNLRTGKTDSVSQRTAERLARVVGTSTDYLWGKTEATGVRRDTIEPEIALLADRIATLSTPRRADLSTMIDILWSADRAAEQYREALMRIASAFLTPEQSAALARALALFRAGDVAAATVLIDSIIQGDADQPEDESLE